jgi:hypothetical protein
LSQSWFYLLQDSYTDKINSLHNKGLLSDNLQKEYSKLKKSGLNYVKSYENSTIIFLKFQNFVKNGIKNNVNPNLIVQTLSSLFEKIRLLANLFDVEKVKQSSEEFLGIIGLKTEKDDKKDEKACDYALSVIEAINNFNNDTNIAEEIKSLLPIKIKIGKI